MTDASVKRFLVFLFVVGAAIRVNNAMHAWPLLSYDGYGHFTYIWYLAETGRIPDATSGWSFFHPPLYYAAMSAIWHALDWVDPIMRLRVGMAVMSLVNLVHAVVAYLIVHRYFPGRRLLHLLAPGIMLFLPLHLYSSVFLGNEGISAAMASLSIFALLHALERPTFARLAFLGVMLGVAMLGKFSELPIVAGAVATIGLESVHRRRIAAGFGHIAVVTAFMLVTCGWFYVENIQKYGTPFKLSRDEFMVQHVEHIQTKGERGFLEYVLFDPVVLFRPQWPRGLPIAGELPPDVVRSSVREAVWTGIYANAWFDGFNSWAVPAVTQSEASRRFGQALLIGGLIPTFFVLWGIWTAVNRLLREGWDRTLGAMLITFVAMVTVFIHGTRVAPLHAAIKATYFMPVTLVFSFWFALGVSRLYERRRALVPVVTCVCVALGIVSVLAFTRGLVLDLKDPRPGTRAASIWDNLRGIIYYAGDRKETAREYFRKSADLDWSLAYENLAAMSLEDGEPQQAAFYLNRASLLAPSQSFGIPQDRAHFDSITRAEHLNTLSVAYFRMGNYEEATRTARDSVAHDREMPQSRFNLGGLYLVRALEQRDAGEAESAEHYARSALALLRSAQQLDPNLPRTGQLIGVALYLIDGCEDSVVSGLREGLRRDSGAQAEYPVETGRGIQHSAAIGRRLQISDLLSELDAASILEICERNRNSDA